MKLFRSLLSNKIEVTVGVYKEKIERKDTMFKDVTSFMGTKTHCFFEQDPDTVVKHSAQKFDCVLFDSPETEELYSKSFHLYSKSTMQVLDLIELDSVTDNRKKAYQEKRSPLEVSSTSFDLTVAVYYQRAKNLHQSCLA